ncbi:hypothetical protein F4808DRAFT_412626 [Astrocystis sublimbata]|nr:hypothetical protein F4808DRAFT_412626 [Astrocystis sublimbata]
MATIPDQARERPEKRVQASDLKRLTPFESPQSKAWIVPLPEGAVSKLVLGFRGSSMDFRYFVYADGPSASGEVVVHIHRSWTGLPIADLTIKAPLDGDGRPDSEADGARIVEIKFEGSQERWDHEMIGLADLNTAKGFAMHVLGDWVFGIRFPKPIWNDVEERFQKATREHMARLEALAALEEEQDSGNR